MPDKIDNIIIAALPNAAMAILFRGKIQLIIETQVEKLADIEIVRIKTGGLEKD